MRLASFTVQFEIGPETRKLIERIVERSAVQLELGPRTLETVRDVLLRERDGTGGAGAPGP